MLLILLMVMDYFFVKFKVFNVPSVAWICSTVPQQDVVMGYDLFAM